MELPGMDIPGIATSYGVQSERVKSLPDLTRAVKDALSANQPRLIEISQRRLTDSEGLRVRTAPGEYVASSARPALWQPTRDA
jgi:TPP-dependent trihydroxycyclohexane-1,2-dione (THcHDO) dehydratase